MISATLRGKRLVISAVLVGVPLCAAAVLASHWEMASWRAVEESRGQAARTGAADGPSDECGAQALFLALLRLSVPVTYDEVIKELGQDAYNSSMLSLRNAADAFGLGAQGKRLTWQELSQFSGVAILWVDGNHFVMVDAGGSSARGERVWVLDAMRLAEWDADELDRQWSGECLILTKP